MTVKEAFDNMPATFQKDKAAGMNAVYQFNITGEGGGEWSAVITDGELTVNEGTHDSPSITLTVSAPDWLDVLSGKLNGQMAFMSGKLKIAGNMGLAMKLGTIFQLG